MTLKLLLNLVNYIVTLENLCQSDHHIKIHEKTECAKLTWSITLLLGFTALGQSLREQGYSLKGNCDRHITWIVNKQKQTLLPGELGLNGLTSSFFDGKVADPLRFGSLSEL